MVFAYVHRLARSNKDVSYVQPWITKGITAEISSKENVLNVSDLSLSYIQS